MAKKTIEVKVGEYTPSTVEKTEFEALIERYKVQNPAKYEQKKAALEARLASLK
jgi:hypothetical protein